MCSVDSGVPGWCCLPISKHIVNNITYPDAALRKNKIQIYIYPRPELAFLNKIYIFGLKFNAVSVLR